MKRPAQHVTDTLGEGLIASVFTPLGWTVSKVEHDYGIDFDIEIFRNHESTGIIFKVQLKSSEKTQYSAQGDFISQSINIQNAQYLCTELNSPVILIHADVAQEAVFWMAPQLDVTTLAKLCSTAEKGSITVRIPTAHSLPKTIEHLVATVGQVETVLAIRTIMELPVHDFVSNVTGHIDPQEFIRQFQDKADALRLQDADNLFRAGKFEEVTQLVSTVFNDNEASIQSKFWALLISERNEILSEATAGAPQANISAIHLKVSTELQSLTKDGPSHLKFFALIARKAAELERLAFRDLGLFMALEKAKHSGDVYGITDVTFRRIAVLRKFDLAYRQCQRLVNYATNFPLRSALSLALLRIVEAIAIFSIRLDFEETKDVADKYRLTAFEICRLVQWIASEAKDDDSLSLTSTTAILLARSSSSNVVQWAKERIAEIANKDIRADAVARFERHLQRIQGQPIEGDIYGKATEAQVEQNIKSALEADSLE